MQTEDPSERYYFAFSFFKVDPKWRWMADLAKQELTQNNDAFHADLQRPSVCMNNVIYGLNLKYVCYKL